MKYSFMSFSCPELNIDQFLKIAVQYGYEGIEPRIGSGHKHGIEVETGRAVLAEAKRKAEDIGIEICCLATSCKFSDPGTAEKNVDEARRGIDLAAALGSPAIRVFGGGIPEGIDREQSFDTIVKSLNCIADFALERKVTVCLETHDDWCDPRAVASIMKNIDHPAVAVNWDIMHPVLSAGYTVESAFRILRPWIRYVHVHDGIRIEKMLAFKQIGYGNVDHKSAIQLLKSMDYKGFVSGEWIGWEPYDIHLPRELSILKQFDAASI